MPKPNRKWERKVHQVVWEDLRPWVEQLWKGYGVLVTFSVTMIPDESSIDHAVRMTAVKKHAEAGQVELEGDYRYIETDEVGATEAKALMMVSRLLLDLENLKAAAEAQQGTLWK